MGFFGRLGLTILGWGIAGPIGALIGYLAGNELDKKRVSPEDQQDIFFLSLIGLLAGITKADGKVDPREKNFVQQFITTQFPDKASELLGLYEKALLEVYEPTQLLQAIKPYLDHTARIALIDVLFKIAFIDNELHPSELTFIKNCAAALGISPYELESIRIQNQSEAKDSSRTSYTAKKYTLTRDEAYKILGLSPNASLEEIKQAYHEKIKKYHPDKFAHLDKDFVKIAEEKTKLFNEAYRILSSQ